MVRSVSVDINGIKRGAWSEEEDNKLRAYIQRYGHWNWRLLPKYAGLARCGKSCRLRWVNYLKPGVKRGNFSKQEEDLIVKLHAQMGNKWSAIAAELPGRSDNEVKNFWHTRIEKRCSKQNFTRKIKGRSNDACMEPKPSEMTPLIGSFQSDLTSSSDAPKDLKSSEVSFHTYPSNQSIAELQVFDFWRDPFVADTTDYDTKDYVTEVHNEFSSGNSSYMSAFYWSLDYGTISTDHSLDRDFPGNI